MTSALRRALRITIAVAVASSVGGVCVAQDDGANFQTWTDFTSLYWLNNNIRYDGDYGLRGVVTERDWTEVYARPSFGWFKLDWLTMKGGLGAFLTVQDTSTFELRPYVGADFIWPNLNGWRFDYYLRLEWRNIWSADDVPYQGDLRGRFRIQLHTPSFGHGFNGLPFYGLASFEFFSDLGGGISEDFASRTRSTIALGHLITLRWRAELWTTLQSSRDNTDQTFQLSDIILRLRIKYHLN